MNEEYLIKTVNEILGTYSIFIATAGTIGNLITAGVCLRQNLRKTPTFIFQAFLSLIEILPLWSFNLEIFTGVFFNLILMNANLTACKIVIFTQFWGLQASSYLLIANAVDRYLSVKMILWRKVYFNSKRAILVSCGILGLFFCTNFYTVLSYNYEDSQGFNVTRCTFSKTMKVLLTVNPYLCVLVPFVLLAILNILLAFTLTHSKFQKSKSKLFQKSKEH